MPRLALGHAIPCPIHEGLQIATWVDNEPYDELRPAVAVGRMFNIDNTGGTHAHILSARDFLLLREGEFTVAVLRHNRLLPRVLM
ncbi:MAG: hypothetical protein V2A55_01895 [Candidatus Jorgensenbacteria bacterium]